MLRIAASIAVLAASASAYVSTPALVCQLRNQNIFSCICHLLMARFGILKIIKFM